jgi:hypothetical protein
MRELKVNVISEVTGANGVVVDSVKLKDGGIVRGVGRATHGHGKAMKKQGKK